MDNQPIHSKSHTTYERIEHYEENALESKLSILDSLSPKKQYTELLSAPTLADESAASVDTDSNRLLYTHRHTHEPASRFTRSAAAALRRAATSAVASSDAPGMPLKKRLRHGDTTTMGSTTAAVDGGRDYVLPQHVSAATVYEQGDTIATGRGKRTHCKRPNYTEASGDNDCAPTDQFDSAGVSELFDKTQTDTSPCCPIAATSGLDQLDAVSLPPATPSSAVKPRRGRPPLSRSSTHQQQPKLLPRLVGKQRRQQQRQHCHSAAGVAAARAVVVSQTERHSGRALRPLRPRRVVPPLRLPLRQSLPSLLAVTGFSCHVPARKLQPCTRCRSLCAVRVAVEPAHTPAAAATTATTAVAPGADAGDVTGWMPSSPPPPQQQQQSAVSGGVGAGSAAIGTCFDKLFGDSGEANNTTASTTATATVPTTATATVHTTATASPVCNSKTILDALLDLAAPNAATTTIATSSSNSAARYGCDVSAGVCADDKTVAMAAATRHTDQSSHSPRHHHQSLQQQHSAVSPTAATTTTAAAAATNARSACASATGALCVQHEHVLFRRASLRQLRMRLVDRQWRERRSTRPDSSAHCCSMSAAILLTSLPSKQRHRPSVSNDILATRAPPPPPQLATTTVLGSSLTATLALINEAVSSTLLLPPPALQPTAAPAPPAAAPPQPPAATETATSTAAMSSEPDTKCHYTELLTAKDGAASGGGPAAAAAAAATASDGGGSCIVAVNETDGAGVTNSDGGDGGVRPNRFVCDKCGKQLNSLARLSKHQLVHTDERPYHCTVCYKSFKSVHVLNSHALTHSNHRPFSCHVCQQTFSKKWTLLGHMRIHDKISDMDLTCPTCSCVCEDPSTYASHIKLHTGERKWECRVCHRGFSKKLKLRKHMVVHSKSMLHRCHICEREFRWKEKLIKHVMLHTGERPFACTVEGCSKAFRAHSDLNVHLRNVHRLQPKKLTYPIVKSEPKPNHCELLLMRVNEVAGVPECDLCQRRFTSKHDYIEHVIPAHRDQQAFVCHPCKQVFGDKAVYDDHMECRHRRGEILWRCHLCPKVYSKQCYYDAHRRLHCTQYQCKICFRFSADKRQMELHIVNHRHMDIDNEEHACTICDRSFKLRFSLKNHMFKVHSIDLPSLRKPPMRKFECCVCQARFIRPAPAFAHMRKVHGLTPAQCASDVVELSDLAPPHTPATATATPATSVAANINININQPTGLQQTLLSASVSGATQLSTETTAAITAPVPPVAATATAAAAAAEGGGGVVVGTRAAAAAEGGGGGGGGLDDWAAVGARLQEAMAAQGMWNAAVADGSRYLGGRAARRRQMAAAAARRNQPDLLSAAMIAVQCEDTASASLTATSATATVTTTTTPSSTSSSSSSNTTTSGVGSCYNTGLHYCTPISCSGTDAAAAAAAAVGGGGGGAIVVDVVDSGGEHETMTATTAAACSLSYTDQSLPVFAELHSLTGAVVSSAAAATATAAAATAAAAAAYTSNIDTTVNCISNNSIGGSDFATCFLMPEQLRPPPPPLLQLSQLPPQSAAGAAGSCDSNFVTAAAVARTTDLYQQHHHPYHQHLQYQQQYQHHQHQQYQHQYPVDCTSDSGAMVPLDDTGAGAGNDSVPAALVDSVMAHSLSLAMGAVQQLSSV